MNKPSPLSQLEQINQLVQQSFEIMQTDPQKGSALANRVYDLALREQNRQSLADCLALLSLGSYKNQEYEQGLEYGLEAYRIYGGDARSSLFIELLNTLGYLYFELGDYSAALDSFQRQESMGRAQQAELYQTRGQQGQKIVYEKWIAVLKEAGEFERAIDCYERLMTLQEALLHEQAASQVQNLEIAHRAEMNRQRETAEARLAQLERLAAEQIQQVQSVMSYVPVILFRGYVYPDGRNEFSYLDGRVDEILGLTPEAVLEDAELYLSLIHFDDRPAIREEVEKALATQRPYHYSHRLVMPDEQIKWVEVVSQITKQSEGKIHWDGIIIDETSRRQAEERANISSERLEMALASAQIGIWEWSVQDNIVVWDDRMFTIFGIDPADFTGTFADFAQRVHPDDLIPAESVVHQDSNAKDAYELRIIRPNGEMRYIQAFNFSQKDAAGLVFRQFGLNIDITDRKTTELALTESEEKFRRMAENVSGMISQCVFYPDGTNSFLYVNSQSRDIYELEPEALMSDTEVLFDRIHPDDALRVRNETIKSFKTMQPLMLEYRLILPKKGLRWVESISKPYRLSNKNVYWDGIVIDITDHKVASIQLEETNDQLARAIRMKDEFLANMSHELRTPLNAILGMAEGLNEGVFGEVNNHQCQAFATIEQAGTHLLSLINDILDLSKIESGHMELTYCHTNIEHFCRSSLEFVKQQAAKREIDLWLNIPPALPEIDLDERRMLQVLINLLSNAVKFTRSGGRVSLEVEPLPKGGSQAQDALRICVRDTGIGIAANHLSKIFEPFIQIDSTINRRYDGTGLGLGLVKRIVELHGGQISVTSEVDVGSCFVVELPYEALSHHRPLSIERDHTDLTTAEMVENRVGLPLVLLAEDNLAEVNSLRSYLQARNYRVQVAQDGHTAVELALSVQPDVILMDSQMAGMEGLTAIQQIRESSGEASQIPIIALTGQAKESDRRHCLDAGADEYLRKPVMHRDVVMLIQALLNQ